MNGTVPTTSVGWIEGLYDNGVVTTVDRQDRSPTCTLT